MTTKSQHDNFADVSLLEYLREDHRPTIVFAEENAGNSVAPAGLRWALAYSNPAFSSFLTFARKLGASIDSDYVAFLHDVETAASGSFDFAGHWWKVRLFLSKWKVVFCEDELDELMAQPDLFTSLETQVPDRPKAAGTTMQRRSDSSSSGETTTGLSRRGLSTKSSISNFAESRELIDWTQYDLPDLSNYIQMFKNIDWGKTPLGPMKDWPIVLRQAVVKLLSNPGQQQGRSPHH